MQKVAVEYVFIGRRQGQADIIAEEQTDYFFWRRGRET